MVQHSETAAQTGTIVGLESPQELQKMSIEQLNELAVNIRSYIISVVSQNGGHLSSNLGVVERSRCIIASISQRTGLFLTLVIRAMFTNC